MRVNNDKMTYRIWIRGCIGRICRNLRYVVDWGVQVTLPHNLGWGICGSSTTSDLQATRGSQNRISKKKGGGAAEQVLKS